MYVEGKGYDNLKVPWLLWDDKTMERSNKKKTMTKWKLRIGT